MRTQKPPVQPEKDVVRECLEWLNAQPGVFVWRNNTGMAKRGKCMVRFGLKGSSDIIGTSDGFFIGAECKRVGEESDEDQIDWLEAMAKCGAIVAVVHSLQELIDSAIGIHVNFYAAQRRMGHENLAKALARDLRATSVIYSTTEIKREKS